MIPTVEWKAGVICLLDQTQLPGRTMIFECSCMSRCTRMFFLMGWYGITSQINIVINLIWPLFAKL